MIVSILSLLVAFAPQTQAPTPVLPYVVSILNEKVGDEVVLRFVLSGPPSSYSATREGDGILVRIAAAPLLGLTLPAPNDPIRSLALGPEPGFTLRLTLTDDRPHEMVRDLASLRLVLKAPVGKAAPSTAAAPIAAIAVPADPNPSPTPSPSRTPNRAADPVAVDTADLYRRLFPTTTDPLAGGAGRTVIGGEENWYSNFHWLGLQLRPWVSVSYVDGKVHEIESNVRSADTYWVVQPNLGLGFSPHISANPRGGQWTINYTPRFRVSSALALPELTSHFLDIGLDQPVASFGSIYANYHFSKGVLETEEIDPGREYGIGLNRVVDTTLEQFQRSTFGMGVRFDFVADTELDVNASTTSVDYGNDPGNPAPGERAFFSYLTRNLNASLRRGLGQSHFVSLLFAVYDTPTQEERAQVEGRGYSYGASLEGDITSLATGRLLFGYRTQKNPNAGPGGRDYKDFTYGVQLVREISEETNIGLQADRRLNLSAYEENGYYAVDSLRADLNTKVPFDVFFRGSVGLQSNNYDTSPQSNDGSSLVLRQDKIRYWSVGLFRNIKKWAYLRFDYLAERRQSNLDRFDIESSSLVFQLGLGFLGNGNTSGRR